MHDYLCHDSIIIRGWFIEAGIVETLNEADSAETEGPLSSEGDRLEDVE